MCVGGKVENLVWFSPASEHLFMSHRSRLKCERIKINVQQSFVLSGGDLTELQSFTVFPTFRGVSFCALLTRHGRAGGTLRESRVKFAGETLRTTQQMQESKPAALDGQMDEEADGE